MIQNWTAQNTGTAKGQMYKYKTSVPELNAGARVGWKSHSGTHSVIWRHSLGDEDFTTCRRSDARSYKGSFIWPGTWLVLMIFILSFQTEDQNIVMCKVLLGMLHMQMQFLYSGKHKLHQDYPYNTQLCSPSGCGQSFWCGRGTNC